jgi:hypothetical protein
MLNVVTRTHQSPPIGTSTFAQVSLWIALLCGVTLFLGFFVALPLPLIVALTVLIAPCALALTVEDIALARRQSHYVSGWRAIGRFLKNLFYLLP